MRFSLFLSTLAALAAAAPVTDLEQRAPCDPSKLTPPAASTPLPAPSSDWKLKMILIGTGTQNYTCADDSASSTPTAIGAVATLHNANCVAVASLKMLDALTQLAYKAPPGSVNQFAVAGHHYFSAPGVPTFELGAFGTSNTRKVGAIPAPNGTADVPWLYLEGISGPVKGLYRVRTNGGVAPASCDGKTAGVFTVPYTAQYWIYA